MEITDEQYEEYQQLIEWAKKENVYKSAKEIENLEDDIDKPIKRVVAMFALLGCKPIYSCCGFDYEGQPFHKSHQYGRPYIILTGSQATTQILFNMQNHKRFMWRAIPNGVFVNVEVVVEMNPHWREHECIHFAEECNIAIKQMESFLVRFYNYMSDSVELEDTNHKPKKQMPYWRYPPKKSWIITKEDII